MKTLLFILCTAIMVCSICAGQLTPANLRNDLENYLYISPTQSVTLKAQGTNQPVTLQPSGSNYVILGGLGLKFPDGTTQGSAVTNAACSYNGSGEIDCTATGTNQNIVLTPSGTAGGVVMNLNSVPLRLAGTSGATTSVTFSGVTGQTGSYAFTTTGNTYNPTFYIQPDGASNGVELSGTGLGVFLSGNWSALNGFLSTSYGLRGGRTFMFNTAPTIASGFGTGSSIPAGANGTAAFTINVGTGGTATTGVLTMPAATTGWIVSCQDVTTTNGTVFMTKQIGLGTTTSVTIGNFTDTGTAGAWASGDILACTAMGH